VSVPLLVVALTVPISYDFYAQLPGGYSATDGLAQLGSEFGNGFAVPSFVLVTFAAPLVTNNVTDASEFDAIGNLTSIAANTSGIQSVTSPVGPDGANLTTWTDLAAASPANRTNLLGVLSGFVGVDGRTVLLTLQPVDAGLSKGAVDAVRSVESSFTAYEADHAGITRVAFGGGAPTIGDLAEETTYATEVMIVAVTIGLVVVLLAVLRSWIIAMMAWAVTDLLFQQLLGFPLFFYVRTILVVLVLGLGIDYNIFLLTRVREERVRGLGAGPAAAEALGRTGGIITAAAVILACAFGVLVVGQFTLIRAIGFAVATAVLLDAMVVRTYLVPASLQLLGNRAWSLTGRNGSDPAADSGAAPPGKS
jgi:putative drug exporter of the RND superfamily